MKRAFTLVEMLVVIGILGVLIATLVTSFGGGTEKARTVKCATNLRNLSAAVSSYAINGSYPYAQSAQYISVDPNGNGVTYGTHRGWISYLDQGVKYPQTSQGKYAQCSFATTDDEEKRYALTNGAIWRASGGNRDIYVCPAFRDACRKAGVQDPGWSYQMNAFFGYEEKPGEAMLDSDSVVRAHELTRAETVLLFAEIPALTLTSKIKAKTGVTALPPCKLNGSNGDKACDSCLLYKSKSGNESIGFNHFRGKQLIGHVAFADGHVEAVVAPRNGNFVELTDWLCRGCDVSYREGSYEKVFDPEDKDNQN